MLLDLVFQHDANAVCVPFSRHFAFLALKQAVNLFWLVQSLSHKARFCCKLNILATLNFKSEIANFSWPIGLQILFRMLNGQSGKN